MARAPQREQQHQQERTLPRPERTRRKLPPTRKNPVLLGQANPVLVGRSPKFRLAHAAKRHPALTLQVLTRTPPFRIRGLRHLQPQAELLKVRSLCRAKKVLPRQMVLVRRILNV